MYHLCYKKELRKIPCKSVNVLKLFLFHLQKKKFYIHLEKMTMYKQGEKKAERIKTLILYIKHFLLMK